MKPSSEHNNSKDISSKKDPIKNSLVYMEGISVRFGKVVALDGVNFSVGKGEIVGLLGDNGAGKTTLIKTLIGLVKPERGKIFFEGRRVNLRCPADARSVGIETVYQDLALIDLLDVTRNFFLGREIEKRIGPFKFLDIKKMNRLAEKFLDENGFTDGNVVKMIEALSGGERQKVAIGRAGFFGTKLLILDEPTASLSESETDEVLNLVLGAKRRGISVIFVTHNAHEVFEVADRFVILQNGRNIANLDRRDTDLDGIEKLLISSRIAAVRQMAAGVAHQIKNPLGIMKVTAEMLRDDFEVKEGKEDYDRLTRLLIDEIDSLNLAINNFLDFARPLKIERESCSISDIVDHSLKNIPTRNFPGIAVNVEINDNMGRYYLDKRLIEQVMNNLIMNALEASGKGSVVTIRAYEINDDLFIEVEDQGVGFSEGEIKHIFMPFYTTKSNGTGLGLPIVKRIVEQHGGSIEVQSRPGEGSVFRLKFNSVRVKG